MAPLPTTRCPVCGRQKVPVRVNGALRNHHGEPGEKCPGSGKTLAEARLLPQVGEG